MEQKVLRVSAIVIGCALALRLIGTVNLKAVQDSVLTPEVASWVMFLQTGRLMRPVNIAFSPQPTQPTPETEPTLPEPTQPSQPPQEAVLTFSPDSAKDLEISCNFDCSADLSALLTQPLSWNLTEGEPTVLILHSHGSESFAPTGTYKEISPYHTLDCNHNMISIGTHVAQLLEAGGISVIHDTVLHDNPAYDASYSNSRASVESYLKEYPSIRLVLDLHRDAFEDENGNQIVRTVFSEGITLAPLMFVVGTDAGGLHHPQWQENLALALKLQTQLETLCPGLCRPIDLRTQRFNQDLSEGALLVEVGASGNTRQEALRTAEVLAEGILSLACGSR